MATAPVVSAPVVSGAAQLAALYVPTRLIKDLGAEQFEKNFNASFATIPQNVALETQYPGSRQAAMEAGLKILSASYDTQLPQWRQKIEALFASQLSVKETENLIDFYRSTTGQKMMRLIASGVDSSALVKRVRENPSASKISSADITATLNYGFLGDMSPAEIQELAKFSLSSGGQKLQALTPQLSAIMTDGVNSMLAAMRGDLQAGIMQAVSQHIAKSRKKP